MIAPVPSLAAAIRRRQREGRMPVLAEVKVRSPEHGDLMRGRSPVRLARLYAALPVAGISVVAAGGPFGGSLDLVARVARLGRPVLCKDFHRTPAGIDAAARAGASCVLLTVALLDDDHLARLHAHARGRGLETLVETHSAAEAERVRALRIRPDLLGVNNRDITVGETDRGDVSVTERVVATLPPGPLVLSESAIAGPRDAVRARGAGADAVLVGTAILTAPDPARAVAELVAVGWPA